MDIFVEELVKRKKSAVDGLIMLGAVVLGIALALALLIFVPPQFMFFGLLLVAVVVYFTYRVVLSFNVEYEYSLVNTEIDIDKIENQRRRKRLTTASIKGLETFGLCKDKTDEYDKCKNDAQVKKVFACCNKSSLDNYFIVYSENGVKKMLVFNPSEKIVSVIEKFNPKKI